MGKYNEAYKDQDLPAITFDKVVKVVLPKLTNRDKREIKQETGVDLMQKFMEAQSGGGASTISPVVNKVFEDVDEDVKDQLDLPVIKQKLSAALPEDNEDPMEKIFDDVDVELEHVMFKKSLQHDDKDINDETIDKIIADLEMLEYIRALMWLIMGRDMGDEEVGELADEVDSKNLNIASKTEK